MPTSARRRERFTSGAVMLLPCTRISPFWMGSSRLTQRMRVLLPEPEGPHTTMTSPPATARFTSASTWRGPNHLSTWRNSMASDMLLDHHQDVAGVDGLSGLHPDLLDGAVPGGPELVLHLHRLEDHEPIPSRHPLAHRDLDEDDAPGHGRLEHLAARGDGPAPGADEVARLFLDADPMDLAVHGDHGDAVLVAEVGEVRLRAEKQRPPALAHPPGIQLQRLARHRHAISAPLTRHLEGNGAALDLGPELQRGLGQTRPDRVQALGPVASGSGARRPAAS